MTKLIRKVIAALAAAAALGGVALALAPGSPAPTAQAALCLPQVGHLKICPLNA